MEVPIPHGELEFDFTDPNALASELDENITGSYSYKLNRFLEDETHKLRSKFIRRVLFLPILEEYIETLISSKDQVRNALELIWFAKFDFDKARNQISKLEVMKNNASSKLANLKRELEGLSSFHFDFKNSIVKSLEHVLKSLAAMGKELKTAWGIHEDLLSHKDKTDAEWRKMANRRNVEESLPGITGELRKLLMQRQSQGYSAHVMECWEMDKYFVWKIKDFQKFVNEEGYKWLDDHIHWNNKSSLLFNCNDNSIDALGMEMVDVSQLFHDM